MDKTWIKAPLTSESYKSGAKSFISFAKVQAVRGEILCPCMKCCNKVWMNIDLAHRHILSRGFLLGYTTWTFHGEQRVDSQFQAPYNRNHSTGEEDIRGLINDALGHSLFNLDDQFGMLEREDISSSSGTCGPEGFDSSIPSDLPPQASLNTSHEDARLKKLLEECDKELYPGCKYSNLSFNLHLYHLNFGSKFRSVKYRFKEKLKKKAKIALKVARQKSDAYVEGEENNYTEEQVFEALDLIPPPSGVADHQWEKYKSNITSKKAQDLSKKGKEARGTQIHTRTTGGISYARIKDEFKLKKKRKPTEVEFFELAYQTKKGTYVQEESKEFMDKAKDLVAQKTMEVGVSGPIDFATESQIHSAVWKELIEGESPRRPLGYGIGVTKSQVTKLSDDLRIMRRGRSSSIEVHALEAKVIAQDKQIQSMGNTINDLKSQVQLFFTAFGMSGGTFSSATMSSPLLRNAPPLQSQGQVQDDGSNVNAMNIPSAYIPSPYDHHEDVCG